MFRTTLLAAASLLGLGLGLGHAEAKAPTGIGVTLGSLGNPYFVALDEGAKAGAQASGASVTPVSADYDLNKQFTQVDNFIAAGDNLILINAVDPNAILPAIKRAQAGGAVVVAVDVSASGANATVQTDNTAAGRISCAYLAQHLHGKGNVVIVNGPQVSAVIDRVKGCHDALASMPGIKVLSDDQNAQGSRDGGLSVMQGLLTRFPDLQGVFAINDPTAVGSALAIKQLHRQGIVVTSVDGAPDIVSELKDPSSPVIASASQDPYKMGMLGVQTGVAILAGHPPAQPITLLAPQLVTRDNVASYAGWSHH